MWWGQTLAMQYPMSPPLQKWEGLLRKEAPQRGRYF